MNEPYPLMREPQDDDRTGEAVPNCSLNWPPGRALHFELAVSAATSYFSR